MAKETMKTNATSNAKPKIQAVVPPELLARYETIVQSGDWDDKASVMEALINAYEAQEYGRVYPTRKKELEAIETACAQVKGTIKHLIEMEAAADSKARASVQSTLSLLEKEAAKVPELRKSHARLEQQLTRTEADNKKLNEQLADEAERRKAAEGKLSEAESKASALQQQVAILQTQINNLQKQKSDDMKAMLERLAARLEGDEK